VHKYSKVTYHDLYPNIDMVFRTSDDSLIPGALHYDFIIHPGGNVNQIKYKYNGAGSQQLVRGFTIQTTTTQGNILEVISEAYEQNAAGDRGKNVDVSFKLSNNQVQFSTNHFDRKQTLVIDPLLLWALYCGGDQSDESRGLSVDSNNNVIIFGRTYSDYNIATSGAFQQTRDDSADLLIEKYDANGRRIWGTYYGGPGSDRGRGVISPTDESIYIAGESSSRTLFATSGVYQNVYGGGKFDAYLALFDSSGVRQWCTYFGGEGIDIARRLRSDGDHNIIMAGHTESTTGIATPGAFQMQNKGAADVFVSKWTTEGHLIWATYLGGDGVDHGRSVHTDRENNILVNGSSGSTHGIPTNDSSWQKHNNGGQDFLIFKMTPDGQLLWCTYYGGENEDRGRGVYTDQNDNIYTTGYSANDGLSYGPDPFQQHWTPGYDRHGNPYHDAMLMRWTPNGKLVWATYIGGAPDDRIRAITRVGDYIYTGGTTSTGGLDSTNDTIIATKDAFQPIFAGGEDMFFEKWDTNGHRVYGTYFGSTDRESTLALARDVDGNLYGTGTVGSSSGIATNGVAQTSYGGGIDDAILVKFRDGVESYPGPKSIGASAFELDPKLNDGNFSIIYTNPDHSSCEIKIYDAIGREVYNAHLNEPFNKLAMNANQWVSGAYTCILLKNGSKEQTVKFMVVK